MKLVKLGLYFLIVISLVQVSIAAIYLGTTEGYIFFQNGSLAEGAFVDVEVAGCSDGCNGNYTSDAGGYYVVANLNLDPGDSVDVVASLFNHYGDNSGTADAFQAAYVNVTMCAAPFSPELINVPIDTHNNSYFLFNWTSGVDPSGYLTYYQFLFDGVTYNNSVPPQVKENLGTFKVYNWGVRTCNDLCCSAYNMSSFNLYNNAPPAPSLTDQGDTINNTVILYWTSGGADADGDSYHFDYRFDGIVSNNVTSPQVESGLDADGYTWCVRACDPWECSSWVCDSFNVINDPPSEPVLVDQGDTDASSVSLSWTSGVDPEGGGVYDQFEFDSVNYGNVTSPQVISLSGVDTHTWRVRTCDVSGSCSSWISDSFISYECPICPDAEIIERIIRRGGGGGGIIPGVGKTLIVSVPAVIPGNDFTLRIEYESSLKVDDLNFNFESPVEGIIVEDVSYGELERDKQISIDIGGSVGDVEARVYTLLMGIYDENELITLVSFDLNVIEEELPFLENEEAYCREKYCETGDVLDPLTRSIIKWIVIALLVSLGISGIISLRSAKNYFKLGEEMFVERFKRASWIAGLIFIILAIALIILLWVWL